MTTDSAEHYRSGEYLKSNPTWHEEDAAWKVSNVSKLIERNSLSPRRILEVGCGTGKVLSLLSGHFPDAKCDGFEISGEAAKIALGRTTERVAFHHGSPFGAAEPADLAMALDVFEHVEDYMGFLRQTRALGEWQIYNIPLDLSVRYVLQKSLIMDTRASVRHLHYFFKDTALATLEDTGHTIVDYIYNSQSLLPGGSLGRRLRAAFRRALFRADPDLMVRVMGGFSLTVLCR